MNLNLTVPGIETTDHFSQLSITSLFAFAAPLSSATTYLPCQDLRLIDLHLIGLVSLALPTKQEYLVMMCGQCVVTLYCGNMAGRILENWGV